MDFENLTEDPAALLRSGGRDPNRMYASVVARFRRAIGERGELAPPGPEDRLKDIRREAVETGFGELGPDVFFPRSGTDVIILGDAVAGPEPKMAMTVRVSAGPYAMDLLVTGDRRWRREAASGELAPTSPEPFSTLAIAYKYAFGGHAETEYGALPDINNPSGIGYYFDEEEALGKPLPNIEDAGAPIRRWNDRPAPVGLAPYPLAWGLRLLSVFTANEATEELEWHPERGLFDRAHPRLSGEQLLPGQRVRIEGMSRRGAVELTLPPCPFEVKVVLGERTTILEPVLEEVLIDMRRSLVDLTYKKLFKYDFIPHQERTTVLQARGTGADSKDARPASRPPGDGALR